MADGLLKQIGETKERLASWIFRGLLAGGIAVLGWLAASTMTDIKDNARAAWQAIGETNKTVTAIGQSLNTLSTTVELHSRQVDNEEADHEQRIRTLERPH